MAAAGAGAETDPALLLTAAKVNPKPLILIA
jgi:hypothetical protein